MSDSVEKYEENKKITLGKVLGFFLVMTATILTIWLFSSLLMNITHAGG